MRLFLLTALTMVAFASNSLLNRAALAAGQMDAVGFANIRLSAGAAMLAMLVLITRRGHRMPGEIRPLAVLGLALYIYAFSLAYVALDAGAGALILFGTVQVVMFVGSLVSGERPPALRWIGAGIAFLGLTWLLWPGSAAALSPVHAGAMVLSGLGWGLYSLAGRHAADPLAASAANFLLALLFGAVLTMLMPGRPDPVAMTSSGIVLAIISGAVTSGLGYALWYKVLPQLPGTVAAVAQLNVPVLAVLGGWIVLAEPISFAVATASVIVLGGVALSVWAPAPRP